FFRAAETEFHPAGPVVVEHQDRPLVVELPHQEEQRRPAWPAQLAAGLSTPVTGLTARRRAVAALARPDSKLYAERASKSEPVRRRRPGSRGVPGCSSCGRRDGR